jgi:hypothetical protein
MSDPGEIVTRVARARWEDHRFRGWGALHELAGQESYLGMTALAATGRRFDAQDRAVLDDLAVILTGAADPRIWPLKITRLVGSYGGTIAGFAAGQLCTECDAIGPWVTGPAGCLLVAVASAASPGEDFAAAVRGVLKDVRRLPGFGVAFRPHDERLLALRRRLEVHGRTRRRWWMLLERLAEVVRADRGIEPNVAVACAATLLDMGMSPREAQTVTNFANQNTFIANAIEAADQSSATLRELPASRVRYVGREPREMPRAAVRRREADAPGGARRETSGHGGGIDSPPPR